MTLWEKVEKQERSGRGGLSYERIAAAGVELADAEGLEAVSMRKVAGLLESGTMSLYRYVSSRDELVELMADHVMGQVRTPRRTGDWLEDLAEVARTSRRVLLRHPWLTGHAMSLHAFGPNTLAMMESTLTLLDGHGLSPPETFELWGTVQSFVQGHVLEERAGQETARRADTSAEQLRTQNNSALHRAFSGGQYPRAAKVFLGLRADIPADDVFERRLNYLLQGLTGAFARRPL
ncbi:MAG: TetR/AcrR family transcriptional regulator [Cystobacter sp.]